MVKVKLRRVTALVSTLYLDLVNEENTFKRKQTNKKNPCFFERKKKKSKKCLSVSDSFSAWNTRTTGRL